MPNLVGPDTLDTASANPATNCFYPAQTLGQGIITSPNIYINKQKLRYSHAAAVPDDVIGQDLVPSPPAPFNCAVPTAPRILINKINKSVYFNKVLPLVQGDLAQALSTERPFVAPFQHPNVNIASKGK
jgi:hypothetical protein